MAQDQSSKTQGLGWLTQEKLKRDAKARLLPHRARTYSILAFSDAPMEFNITLLLRAAQLSTIHNRKAVGEPPLMLAIVFH